MLISEKQVMQLFYIATEYRRDLLDYKTKGILSEAGQIRLSDTSAILASITNQQSEELRVIE